MMIMPASGASSVCPNAKKRAQTSSPDVDKDGHDAQQLHDDGKQGGGGGEVREASTGGDDDDADDGRDTTTATLYDLLRREVEPSSHQALFLPFFSTDHLLRLSECSQSLLSYRFHLSRVRLAPHRTGTQRMEASLMRLLPQQRPGVRYLHLGHRGVMPSLAKLAASAAFRALEALDLSRVGLKDEDAACLGDALASGGLKSLRALGLSAAGVNLTVTGWSLIMGALAAGACPSLERLDMSMNQRPEIPAPSLARALQSGHCRRLQDLDLAFDGPISLSPWFTTLAAALMEGGCPDLRKLRLECCTGAGRALGAALRSGYCNRLRELSLYHAYTLGFNEEVVPIMAALEAGCCPDLERLQCGHAFMSEEEGGALARVLTLGGCPRLQSLHIFFTHQRQGISRVLQAIKQGGGRELCTLALSDTGMDLEHGQLLGEAMSGGALARLEELVLSSNKSLGPGEGLGAIMRGVEAGGCPQLKRLDVALVGLKAPALAALTRTVASGKLSNLETLVLEETHPIGDDPWTSLLKALSSGTCGRLQSLSMRFNGACQRAGQALVEALRDHQGSWPHLRCLTIMNKHLREGWVCELASILAQCQGQGPPLRLRELRLQCRVNPEGFRKLGQLFREGACDPWLKVFYLNAIVRHGELDSDDMVVEALESALQGRGVAVDVRISWVK